MTESVLFVLILAVLIGGFLYLAKTLRPREKDKGDESLLLIQNQLNDLNRTLGERLNQVGQATQHQFSESVKLVASISERLAKLDETNRQVVSFADQLKSLQDILKNPKQRGILGEYYLEAVLKNVLPPGSYQMQYPFKNGVIVDAVVLIDKRIIPIDSKFSLENYNRILEARDATTRAQYEKAFVQDLKTRIDETAKYVKPEEDTMDFAFMFIPSEAVYYDLLINKVGAVQDDTNNLVQYAARKRVIVVSPTSFLAYLQTVLQGLKNQKISEQARDIIKQVENLSKHLGTYENYLEKLGKNLGITVSAYNSAYKEFGKIDKDLFRVTGASIESEPLTLDRPSEIEEGE